MTLMIAVADDPGRPGIIPAEWAPGTDIAWFVMVLVCLSLVMVLQLLPGKSRSALKVLAAASDGEAAAYCLVLIAASLVAPATIVKPGSGYCIDLSCMEVQNASRADALVTVNVRIFSAAKSATTSVQGASIYMVDDRGTALSFNHCLRCGSYTRPVCKYFCRIRRAARRATSLRDRRPSRSQDRSLVYPAIPRR